MQKIPFNKPPHVGTEESFISDAIRNGKLSGDGPYTKLCTAFFEKRMPAKKVLLTTSGTHALEMAAYLCKFEVGDEVIMPSFTFSSTANAFVQMGCRIAFVDIDPQTMNIDPAMIDRAINNKTRAIVVVHYAGVACDMNQILEIAREKNLVVIEDAAHAVNAFYQGRPLGTIGDFGCLSFHETKNYSMGEGGAIIIGRESDYYAAEVLREKGTDRSKFLRGQVDKYSWVDYGSSYLPSELNAAYLYGQLQCFEEINIDRLATWDRYKEGLMDLTFKELIELPTVPSDCQHNAHMFYIKVDNIEERTRLGAFLKERGVGSAFHYVPLHSSNAGKKFGYFSGVDKFTTRESDRLLRLPMYYGLLESEVFYIVDVIHDFFRGD